MNNRLLLVLKYLWDYTDETNQASCAQIVEYLKENGIKSDRKTVARNIDTLIDFGFDIIKTRKIQNQYFLATRLFEGPEVKMLIDAVQSARFLTKKKSKELINKLSTFVAPSQAAVLKRHLYVDERNKTYNEAVYIITDSIQNAIIEKRKISFQYFDYDIRGRQLLRQKGDCYIVSPYDLIWSNDSYYLAGFHEKKGIVAKFRVDRMLNLKVLEDRVAAKPKGYSVAEFFNHEFSMFDGEDCVVTLLCENSLINSVIDRFGKNTKMTVVDDNHFKITVPVDLSSLFYGWVFASEGRMKIVSPKEAINGFNKTLEKFKN